MTELGKYKDYIIDLITNTLEKYISFKMYKPGCTTQLVFLDSYQFLSNGGNLDTSKITILKHHFPNDEENQLLRRKGVYPYDYLNSMQKFDEEQLPPPT